MTPLELKARVTVGVPAYNNGRTIAATLKTLEEQTFRDIRVVISDDRSSDDTQAICMAFASRDARFTYIRQEKNLRYQNFGYLLRSASTEYFMWAAGDDLWDADFVSRCVACLDQDSSAVLAVTEVEFIDGQTGRRWIAPGTFALSGAWAERFARYIRSPEDNSRMYGLMRTRPAQASFPPGSFHAYDWAFSAALTRHGCHVELPGIGLRRDKTASVKYIALARADSIRPVDRWFPVWRMSAWLIRHGHVPRSIRCWLALAWINIDKHREYVDHQMPYAYHPLALAAAVARRLRRMLFS